MSNSEWISKLSVYLQAIRHVITLKRITIVQVFGVVLYCAALYVSSDTEWIIARGVILLMVLLEVTYIIQRIPQIVEYVRSWVTVNGVIWAVVVSLSVSAVGYILVDPIQALPGFLYITLLQAVGLLVVIFGVIVYLSLYMVWNPDKPSQYFGFHADPSTRTAWLAGFVPAVLIIGAYFIGSETLLMDNPSNKLMPAGSTMADSVERLAFTEHRRTGEYVMLVDTMISLSRLGLGLLVAAIFGFFVGVRMGLLKGFEVTWSPIITFMSNVPPLAIMPILIIAFGAGEFGKFMLIFLGTVFVITRDVYMSTKSLPEEIKVQALTLGAGRHQMYFRIVMPLMVPRLIAAVRITLPAAWLFLLAAEMLAASSGLGYRINLMTRYMEMSVILPYVVWITFLAFNVDISLRILQNNVANWSLAEHD